MRLDRNTNPKGWGKYALLKLRRQPKGFPRELQECADKLRDAELLDFGTDPDKEFFVIRLRDKHAAEALKAYAKSALADDPELAADVLELARKAELHPNKHAPD